MFFKKAQIVSQIFIYLIAIILSSFILLYGYNAIKGFKERSEQISYIKFKTDLTSTVTRISPDFGTIKREEFFIGGDYRRVCFVQNYKPINILSEIDQNKYPLVYDSVRSGVNKNVFLFSNTLQESFDVGQINVSKSGYDCVLIVNGKIKLQFEGKGDHTYISGWG